jgi:hypothetical protein
LQLLPEAAYLGAGVDEYGFHEKRKEHMEMCSDSQELEYENQPHKKEVQFCPVLGYDQIL